MAEKPLPYVPSYGQIKTVLGKIKQASTPERFTQDYLATTLDMKGGGPKPLIPFLKRIGFLGSDGAPTDLYKKFRGSPEVSGAAAAQALRIGYQALYQVNEHVHDAKDADLKGLVVQVTGYEEGSSTVRSIIGSFKALKEVARFDLTEAEITSEPQPESANGKDLAKGTAISGLSLGYTINLHLPSTSDITVFNAIFKSLREHLLTED
ncbi:MAG: DUF5343 domain-containing protein [Actinomycetota bacterium]|nr:DUF5343 domain-containing protein [Actinomycetota bacterium]